MSNTVSYEVGKNTRSDEEIDILIDLWHEDEDTTLPLHVYLGFTWDEWKIWIMKDDEV